MSIKPINAQNNASLAKTVNQENANMTQTTDNNQFQAIFDSRRQFAPSTGWGKRVDLTLEQIETLSPYATIMKLFADGRIRVTNHANGTRKDAVPALFPNNPQSDQIARALALFDYIPYMGHAMSIEPGYRMVGLLDKKGDRDIIVYEKKNVETGWVEYTCFYATKQYNQHGEIVQLNESGEDKVQAWLKASIDDGYLGFDGVQRQSHNQWVDSYNEALKAVAMGKASDAQRQLVSKADTEFLATDPNKFVTYNSRRHVGYESVANKYAVLSWLVLDATRPAFEIYSRAKTVESNQKFIEGWAKSMERGYRNQLKTLAGLYATE